MNCLWMLVDKQNNDLPLFVADSPEELSRDSRIPLATIYRGFNRKYKHSKYVKCFVDDEEEEF